MPVVTVPARPSGEPMAMTPSPTRRSDDRPSWATTELATSTFTTAMSVCGSRPTIRAVVRAPDAKTASRVARGSVAASETTWLFVTMSPRESITTPEPVPPVVPDRTSMETTAGTTRPATSATDPAGRSLPGSTCARLAPGSISASEPSAVRCPTTPPTAPTSRAMTARSTSALGATRRPKSSSRAERRGPGARRSGPGSPSRTAGAPSSTAAAGSRQGSRSVVSPAQRSSASCPVRERPGSDGRCRVSGVPSGRPKALARATEGSRAPAWS